jgi:hypothetical protein
MRVGAFKASKAKNPYFSNKKVLSNQILYYFSFGNSVISI